jgi:hypothetical protein
MKYILYRIPEADMLQPPGVKHMSNCGTFATGMIPDDFLHLLNLKKYEVTFITEGMAKVGIFYADERGSYSVKKNEQLSVGIADVSFRTKDKVYATEEEMENAILLTKEIKKIKFRQWYDKKFDELKIGMSELELSVQASPEFYDDKLKLHKELKEKFKLVEEAKTMHDVNQFDPMRELHDSVLDDEGID